jgi:hypothetical protein
MMNREGYVLTDGRLIVALDAASGGYPYLTDRFPEIKIWETVEEAREYNRMFKNEYTVRQIEVRVSFYDLD